MATRRISPASEAVRERRTDAQAAQDHNRDERGGKYARGPVCEACGKPAGWDYVSLETCNEDGIGVVLCNRKRCPAALGLWPRKEPT